MNSKASQGRGYDRQGRLLKAHMRHPRTGLLDIMIRNVSPSGIGGKCVFDLEPGEMVTIIMPDGPPIDGMIVWRVGHGFGVRLNAPIDLEAITNKQSAASLGRAYEVPRLFRPVL